MPPFNSEIVREILASCESGREAASKAFEAAFGMAVTIAVGEPTEVNSGEQAGEWEKPGLLFVFETEGTPLFAMLPSESGIIPDWCRDPDEDAQQKLETLGREIAKQLLPASLAVTLKRVEFAESPNSVISSDESAPSLLPLKVGQAEGEESANLWLVLPSSPPVDSQTGQESAPSSPTEVSGVGTSDEAASREPVPASRPRLNYVDIEDGIRQLPTYAQSLLKIRVPMSVTLAETKLPLDRILDLGPGTIIQFKKSCEEALTLEVGGQEVAEGEAVKVGDKFGLWITAISMPEERFWVMQHGMPGQRVR